MYREVTYNPQSRISYIKSYRPSISTRQYIPCPVFPTIVVLQHVDGYSTGTQSRERRRVRHRDRVDSASLSIIYAASINPGIVVAG